ncbi:cation-dependent mannose-6-phosphate receptor [Sparus aurata]|uniref:Cation-dependent mannose-6-phosphate receptor n=1 Tax=Sparus aurata TaxID=8175 RepID=A0A671WC00_SPAAU|nr:cation-dependent mannose-6-phosphate receptor [Sparus aurata]XP_030249508.1 cation-dependent mannose-6-phosphate receptor [Sparus aurata]
MEVVNSHSGGSFLIWIMTVQLILCGSGVYTTNSTKSCRLLSESKSEWKVLNRLEPLANKNFTVETKDGDESYTYVFQLCGDAGGIPGAGVVQFDKKNPDSKPKVIGIYSATQAIGGSDWVMLIYKNGTAYSDHCGKEMRKAYIMISCNRKVDMGPLDVVLEDRARVRECFYLFEMDSSAVCPPVQSQLSTGSIILIIGFCLLAVYLIGGFLYQRLIVGAKGMEQFPNYAFWVEMGNLTADGCDFMCRSRNREEAPAYRGVVAEPLEEEPEERDDHLLPM